MRGGERAQPWRGSQPETLALRTPATTRSQQREAALTVSQATEAATGWVPGHQARLPAAATLEAWRHTVGEPLWLHFIAEADHCAAASCPPQAAAPSPMPRRAGKKSRAEQRRAACTARHLED